MKKEIERASLHLDYFRDDKNRICQVLTWHHPQDRRLCIVKYDLGDSFWTSRETGLQYKRILESYSLEGHQTNLELVKKIEPTYHYVSKVYGVDFLAVPLDRIIHYYYPEKRLQEILDENKEYKNDDLEIKVKKLAELLHDYLNIPFENMGITGSILWKAQTQKSDIDFIIYGNAYAQDFNEKFPIIYEVFSEINPMLENKSNRYVISMARKSGLPKSLTRKYIELKTWLSVYGKTNLSLIFSPTKDELPFIYGEQLFKPIKPIIIECTINNADLGCAYPSIYQITDCKILTEKSSNFDIQRILSFEGALTGYFKINNRIVAQGLLEEVRDIKTNNIFHQIILGTKECFGNEFILFQEDYEKFIRKQ
ncbi:MAG: hypothetical protein JXA54_04660 [Candidatus Heimdallarchaeota archaeon]|nr:hypothetical protein [Candidatus Heimdallarchaeota archaeon]